MRVTRPAANPLSARSITVPAAQMVLAVLAMRSGLPDRCAATTPGVGMPWRSVRADLLAAAAVEVLPIDALHDRRGSGVGHEAGLALPSRAALRTDPQRLSLWVWVGALGEVAVALSAVGPQPAVDAVLMHRFQLWPICRDCRSARAREWERM